MRKIFLCLFVYFSITGASAQSFEELYTQKWCQCTDKTFPNDTEFAGILEKIAATITKENGSYNCDFEVMRAYFEDKPEAKNEFKAKMKEFGDCLASNNIQLNSSESENLQEPVLEDKFPRNSRKFNKKFDKITEKILTESENCQKGQVIYFLWLDGFNEKYGKK